MATSVERDTQVKAIKLLRTSPGIFTATSHTIRKCELAFNVSIDELIDRVLAYISVEGDSTSELACALNVNRSASNLKTRRKHMADDQGVSTRTLVRREDESIEKFVKQFSSEQGSGDASGYGSFDTTRGGNDSSVNVSIDTLTDLSSLSLTELGEEIAKLGAVIDALTVRRDLLSTNLNRYILEMSKRSQ